MPQPRSWRPSRSRATLRGVARSVWERKDGRFGAEYPVPIPGGTKTLSTMKTIREAAEAWRAKMEEDVSDCEPVVSGSQSVGQYLDEWLRDAVEPSVTRRTYEKRAWAVNLHLKPVLGGIRLRDLDARRIQSLYASVAHQGYSYSTRREIHVTLKMALGQALKRGLVRRNECDIADVPREISRGARGKGPVGSTGERNSLCQCSSRGAVV